MKLKMFKFIFLILALLLSGCISKSQFDELHSPYYDTPFDFSINSLSATTNSATLHWQNSHNARTYSVKYKEQADTDFTTASTDASSGYTVSGLTLSHTYSFKIEAVGISGTKDSNTIALKITNPPVASAISTSINIGQTQIISLSYTDAENDQATTCSVDPASLSAVSITSACTCSLGICQVGIRETGGVTGNAHFTFTVTANYQTSNSALVDITVF